MKPLPTVFLFYHYCKYTTLIHRFHLRYPYLYKYTTSLFYDKTDAYVDRDARAVVLVLLWRATQWDKEARPITKACGNSYIILFRLDGLSLGAWRLTPVLSIYFSNTSLLLSNVR